MARGIQEGDHAVLGFYVVGTDVLGNAAGFARRHFGGADVVQQRGFTVVNVAHDGHDRRARLSRSARITVAHQRFFQLVFTTQNNFVAHLFGNQLCGFLVDNLVDGGHSAQLHHHFDDLRTFYRHLVGQLGHGDGFTDHHVTVNHLRRLVEALLQSARLAFAFTATGNGTRFFAIRFGFGQLVAFLLLGRFAAAGAATTIAFNFGVVFVFCGTRMLRGGHVIVGTFNRSACRVGLGPLLAVLFGHATGFFRHALGFLFNLAAHFLFRFTFQFSGFGFTACFFRLSWLGHFVGMLIGHFFFFR